MRRKKPYDRSVFQAFTLVLQFGINMLVPIGMMCALGIFLDHRLGTSFFTILLFFVGAVAGANNVYRMAKNVYDKNDDRMTGSVYDRNGDRPLKGASDSNHDRGKDAGRDQRSER